jgi:hypothetical protein
MTTMKLYRIERSQEDDQLLREGREWPDTAGRQGQLNPTRAGLLDEDSAPAVDGGDRGDDLQRLIYDHLLPHATQIKVAHPLMLRAIAAAKKKTDQIDASKIADNSKRIGSVLFQPKCCHWIDASGSSSRNPDGDQRDCAKKQWCHDKGGGVPSLDSE